MATRPTSTTPTAVLPAPADLLTALDRMLTVGSYYTADHECTVAVASAVHEALVGIAGDRNEVTIAWSTEGFAVCGESVEVPDVRVRRLSGMMSAVGAGALTIATATTSDDLREAFRILQANRHALSSSQGLTEIQWTGMPDSVRVAENTMQLVALPKGVPEELLDLPGEAIVEKPGSNDGAPTPDSAVPLPDADPTIRPDGTGSLTDSDEIATVVSLAAAARKLTESPDLVDLVFGKLRRSGAPEETTDKERKAPRPDDKTPPSYDYSIAGFLNEVTKLELSKEDPRHRRATTRAEFLGVCMQALRHIDQVNLTDIIAGLRRELKGSQLTSSERQVVSAGVADVCAELPVETTDLVLTTVRDGLRDSDPMALANLWLSLRRDGDAERWSVLRPHVLASLLDGMESVDSNTTAELWRAIAAFDQEEAKTMVPRFEALLGGGVRRIPASLWEVPLSELVPVLALLLHSRMGASLGPQLHYKLSLGAEGSLAVVLMDMLQDYDPRWHGLYLALSADPEAATLPRLLVRQAAKILHHVLNRLPMEDHSAPWLPVSLVWYQQLYPRGAEPLLRRVVSERRLWFWPVWPTSCREIAGRLLQAMATAKAEQAEESRDE